MTAIADAVRWADVKIGAAVGQSIEHWINGSVQVLAVDECRRDGIR